MNPKQDLQRAQRGIEEFLRGLGFDPDTDPRLKGTCERVVRTWEQDLLCGVQIQPPEKLLQNSISLESKTSNIVVLRNLATVTICPHHLLPAVGHATVVYVPAERVAGLGTIAKLVDHFARRMELQEKVGQNVACALVQHLGAKGALCRLSMLHTCLVARGEYQHNARLETVAYAGSMALEHSVDRELALSELAKTTPSIGV